MEDWPAGDAPCRLENSLERKGWDRDLVFFRSHADWIYPFAWKLFILFALHYLLGGSFIFNCNWLLSPVNGRGFWTRDHVVPAIGSIRWYFGSNRFNKRRDLIYFVPRRERIIATHHVSFCFVNCGRIVQLWNRCISGLIIFKLEMMHK